MEILILIALSIAIILLGAHLILEHKRKKTKTALIKLLDLIYKDKLIEPEDKIMIIIEYISKASVLKIINHKESMEMLEPFKELLNKKEDEE